MKRFFFLPTCISFFVIINFLPQMSWAAPDPGVCVEAVQNAAKLRIEMDRMPLSYLASGATLLSASQATPITKGPVAEPSPLLGLAQEYHQNLRDLNKLY